MCEIVFFETDETRIKVFAGRRETMETICRTEERTGGVDGDLKVEAWRSF